VVKEISPKELKAALDNQEEIQLIDVRELHENKYSNIGGIHIAMKDLPEHLNQLSKNKRIVIYCRSGGRSANLIQWLETNYGFSNLYNLRGGLVAWHQEIDASLNVF
jgi:rhodanese-related sulfurtransferase